jgi:hypothetical protein
MLIAPKDPLGLPAGSVRAILTLLLVAVSAALLFVPSVESASEVRAMFVMLTGIAVRDYFASRGAQDAEQKPSVYINEPDEA